MRKLNISIGAKNKPKPEENFKLENQPLEFNNETQEKPIKPANPRKFRISKKTILILLIIVFFGGVAAFAYYRFNTYSVRVQSLDQQGNSTGSCSNILNPSCWTEAFKPQLKQVNNQTTALILGLDTRPNGSLLNSDSMMLITYDHTTHKTMLISIARDFYDVKYHIKLNDVYALTLRKDPNDQYHYIKDEITSITGYPIQYVVKVYMDAVSDLVTAIGGIQVCPTDNFTAAYPNPNAKPSSPDQWLYYDFTKGCQDVNGEKALVYSRFRHLRRGPSYLESDFSRIRRQQEVIKGVENKLLSVNLSLQQRVENYWSVLQTIDKDVRYDFTYEDALAAIALIDSSDKVPADVFVDPNLGGLYSLITEGTNATDGYTIRAKDSSYAGIRKEIASIATNVDFYKESPKIVVRNQTGTTLAKTNVVYSVKNDNKYLKSFDVFNDTKTDKYIGIKLFDLTGGTKPGSLAIIKSELGVENVELLPETYGVSQSSKKEDFLILVGPDAATPTPAVSVSPTI